MRQRLVAAGAVVLVGTVLGGWGVGGVLRVREIDREIAAAERAIAALRTRAEQLTATIDRLRNDPAYIEKLAREEHGLVREGETVLKFPAKSK
ncbi:MAG: septum formation initiator family protein [Candidatus Rokuibacteriota bacterium]